MLTTVFSAAAILALQASASPIKQRWAYEKYFDLQGHRGGRGEAVESTLPAFAWGLLAGVTTLEMDVGLTKDGVPIVWHDEVIDKTKCKDSAPAFANDTMYPYVGKNVANLTLAQIKTLDCGSLRIDGFPRAEVYPGTKLSTLDEMFDFVQCATSDPVLFNIESKINPDVTNQTRSPADFVAAMGKVFVGRGADVVDRITHQSFDWRALVLSKAQYPTLRTAALCDDTTLYRNPTATTTGNLTVHGTGPSNWLAGIDIDSLQGATVGERVARAAKSIKADILSPVGSAAYASVVQDVSLPGYIPFVNQSMVDTAHSLGMEVVPWTVDRKNNIEYLLALGVDGIISDYPSDVRILLERRGKYLAPKANEERVMGCLKKLVQVTKEGLPTRGY
ncbi:Glycerophosphoryl diester phosphodiesterase [Dioszegia hungarica]|uniref:Glycerophosphoryl diester phosphodiesterase n=1 Tax=Dioszegia hungarica TaxID=4972 RepID=A0AA38LWU5_9TREE|nr:Glycerophosphoryl diester phosphodiesterase [Dioszegia hungarica]KAI9639087.1 Glycerophosphoryl diester phosphodiesterase [Dioszegia hungarica]